MYLHTEDRHAPASHAPLLTQPQNLNKTVAFILVRVMMNKYNEVVRRNSERYIVLHEMGEELPSMVVSAKQSVQPDPTLPAEKKCASTNVMLNTCCRIDEVQP